MGRGQPLAEALGDQLRFHREPAGFCCRDCPKEQGLRRVSPSVDVLLRSGQT